MKLLPGYVSDPHWMDARCATCARPVGGDSGMMQTCEDSGQQHMTFERIPAERRDAFVLTTVWSNAQEVMGRRGTGLIGAIKWMTEKRKGSAPVLARLEDGRGLEVLEAQYDEFPELLKTTRFKFAP